MKVDPNMPLYAGFDPGGAGAFGWAVASGTKLPLGLRRNGQRGELDERRLSRPGHDGGHAIANAGWSTSNYRSPPEGPALAARMRSWWQVASGYRAEQPRAIFCRQQPEGCK